MSGLNTDFRVQLLEVILMSSINVHQGCHAAKSKIAEWCGCVEGTLKDRVRTCRNENLIRIERRARPHGREATSILRLTERGWWYLLLRCKPAVIRRFESKIIWKRDQWRLDNAGGRRPLPRIAISLRDAGVHELRKQALSRLKRIRAKECRRWGLDRGFDAVWAKMRALLTADRRMRSGYAPRALKKLRPCNGESGPELAWSIDRYFTLVERRYMPIIREYFTRKLPGYPLPRLVAGSPQAN